MNNAKDAITNPANSFPLSEICLALIEANTG